METHEYWVKLCCSNYKKLYKYPSGETEDLTSCDLENESNDCEINLSSTNEWNKSITATLNIENWKSYGLSKISNNDAVANGKDKITIDTEGKDITVYAYLKNGLNIKTCSTKVNIDTTSPSKPNLTLYKWNDNSNEPKGTTQSSKYTSNTWTNKNVEVMFNANDTLSGIEKYKYILDNGTEKDTKKNYLNITSEKSHTLKVRACDKAGNCGNYSDEVVIKIDKSVPSVSINNPSNGNWTNNNFALKLSSNEAGSGIVYWSSSYKKVSSNATATGNDTTGWVNYRSSANKTFTTPPFSTELNKIVYIRACDNAGNCNSSQTAIKIDKTAPTCGTATGASTAWTNRNRTIKQACNDSGSGCVKASYDTEYTSNKTTASIDIKDNVGNTRTCTYNVYIDKTAPTCSFSPNKNPDGDNGWYKSTVVANASFADTGGSEIGGKGVSTGGATYNNSTSYTVSNDTNGITINCYVKDKAGNAGSNSITIKRDTVKPKWEKNSNNFDLSCDKCAWFKSWYSDYGSGLRKISTGTWQFQYQYVNSYCDSDSGVPLGYFKNGYLHWNFVKGSNYDYVGGQISNYCCRNSHIKAKYYVCDLAGNCLSDTCNYWYGWYDD